MWVKNNNFWENTENSANEAEFTQYIEKLRSYSKGLVSAGYTLTTNLNDVYGITRKQHAFWIINLQPVTIVLDGYDLEPGQLYDLSENFTASQLNNSAKLCDYLGTKKVKAANSNLFVGNNFDWFMTFKPGDSTVGHENLILDATFTPSQWMNVFTDSSDGYTITNVFTNDAVYRKLLRNYYMVEAVGLNNVPVVDSNGITISYPLFNLDGLTLNDNFRVLLTNQDNPIDNGIYIYSQNSFTLLDAWKNAKDYDNVIVYVTSGTHASQEYVLSIQPTGEYPTLDTPKVFEAKNVSVIRSEISYTLPQQHGLTSVQYINTSEPNITTEFRDQVMLDNEIAYVGSDLRSIIYNEIAYSPSKLDDFIPTIAVYASNLVAVYRDGFTYKLWQFNPLTSVETSTVLLGNVTSHLIENGTVYYTSYIESELGVILHQIYSYSLVATGSNSDLIHSSNKVVSAIAVTNNATDTFLFCVKSGVISLILNGSEHQIALANAKQLRVTSTSTDLTLRWLEAGRVTSLTHGFASLRSMLTWSKGVEYQINTSGKTSSGSLTVRNGKLYKNDVIVTGISEADKLNIPKLNDLTERSFDGVDDYAVISSMALQKLRNLSAFSLEFAATPSRILPNTPLLYIGDKVVESTDLVKTLPSRHLTIFLSDENGFPYLTFAFDKKIITIKSPIKIVANKKTYFGFTWEHTGDKVIARLYIDGKLVSDYTDTKSSVNPLIDLSTFAFDAGYFSKSEDETLPSFQGTISQFRLWNQLVSTSDLNARLHSNITNKDVLYKSLLNQLVLDDKTATLVDTSSLKLNGSFVGGIGGNPLYYTFNNVPVRMIQRQDTDLYVLFSSPTTSTIVKIDTLSEAMVIIKQINDEIKSICYTDSTMYYYASNNIYKNVAPNDIIIQGVSNDTIDFTVVDNQLFLFKSDNKLYSATGALMFAYDSTFDCLYGELQNDSMILYIKSSNGVDTILKATGNSATFLGYHPLEHASITDLYSVVENKLQRSGVLQLTPWSLDAYIFSVQKTGLQHYVVGVIEKDNTIQLWSVFDVNGKAVYTRYTNAAGEALLGSSLDRFVDITFYNEGATTYAVLMNNSENSVMWVKLEYNNKLDIDCIPWVTTFPSQGFTYERINYGYSSLFRVSTKNNKSYLSVLSKDANAYDLWKRQNVYLSNNEGIIGGTSGIMLRDSNGNLVDRSLAYRDDITVAHSFIDNIIDDETGSVVYAFAGKQIIVGKNGNIYSINDGKTTLVPSNVPHDLRALSFYDIANGLVVGDYNTVLTTSSGGGSYQKVSLPESAGLHDFYTVLQYAEDKALVGGGQGSLLHLIKINGGWIYDQTIRLTYGQPGEEDLYFKTIRDIQYVGNKTYAIIGDGDLVCILTITENDSRTFTSTYFSTGLDRNWFKGVYHVDKSTNQRSFILMSEFDVYTMSVDRYSILAPNVVNNTSSTLLYNSKNRLNDICIVNNTLVVVGAATTLVKIGLYKTNSSGWIVYDLTVTDSSGIKDLFKPRMLFLDYFMARKINLHTNENERVVPSVNIAKSILNDFRFNPGDSLTFTSYSGATNQANYLAHQDFTYLNSRASINGVMATWKQYNKRFTAVSDAVYKAKYSITLPVDGALVSVFTERMSVSQKIDALNPLEDSLATKIKIKNTTLEVNDLDVIEVTFLQSNNTIRPVIGDMISLKIHDNSGVGIFDIEDSGVIGKDGTIHFKQFSFSNWHGKLLTTSEAEVKAWASAYYDTAMRARCLSTPTVQNLSVELRIVRAKATNIVKQVYTNSDLTYLILTDVWNSDMIEDLSSETGIVARIRNLNYFNGDLQHLQDILQDHLVGESYKLKITQPGRLEFEGVINRNNVYHNLETKIVMNIGGTTTTHDVSYDAAYTYSPSYTLEAILSQLDPVFTAPYTFNMPQHSYTLQFAYKGNNGGFTEFNYSGNKFYVGNDYPNICEYQAGTFIDIVTADYTIQKVYIDKIDIEYYANFPTKKRYVLHTDTQLQQTMENSIGVVTLRSRDTLREISTDLEITDNVTYPVADGGTYSVKTMRNAYFNQLKTGGAYAKFLLNDNNVRKHVSLIGYLDAQRDWVVSVINWNTDNNLVYRPTDLFNIGTDGLLTKPVAISNINYDISEKFSLVNIDPTQYTFTLVDGLSLKAVEAKYHWILNATLRNAVIGEDEDGLVWYKGDWLGGVWEGGKWYSGTARSIEWLTGDMYSYRVTDAYNKVVVDKMDSSPEHTVWYSGEWVSGNFYNGTRLSGGFTGTFHGGTWTNGTFIDGTWKEGRFDGGLWKNGTWLSGNFSQNNSIAVWENGSWFGGDFESGIWKNGIWDQTDRLPSRFGTGATNLKKAIWEYGTWKNGDFYSGSSIVDGELVASENYSNSSWLNGTWLKGNFHGGTWTYGSWKNGVWFNGYVKDSLQLENISVKDSNNLTIRFNQKHYFKDTSGYITIMGNPVFNNGLIDEKTIFLGYNQSPKLHYLRGIVDEYTVLIGSDPSFATTYVPGVTTTTIAQQLDAQCAITTNQDYSIIPFDTVETVDILPTALPYAGVPMVATHWVNGTWYGGIWEYGYFNDGTFKGGIWVDGVNEKANFRS